MKKIVLVVFLSSSVFCITHAQHNHGGDSDNNGSAHKEHRSDALVIPRLFQMQLGDVFRASIQLKDALVQSDASKAGTAAFDVKTSISKADMMLLKNEMLMDWMMYLKTFNESLDTIIASSGNLTAQRKAFALFSNTLYKSIKTFGIRRPVYYDYCPMANNNEGAYWVSDEKEIKNPYFGQEMMTCGSVKETIDK